MDFLKDMPEFHWDAPVYIIGNPRSGTSLLRLMMHLHPDICIPPESHFFLWLYDKYTSWNPEIIEDYLDDLYTSTKFETWEMPRTELKDFIVKNTPNSYSQVNSLIYLYYALKSGKEPAIWGDKNKLWKERLEDILRIYPKTKFIHVVRDGRDIVCSFREIARKKLKSKYAPNVPLDIQHLASRWKENILAILSFEKKVPAGNFLTIQYEEMLPDTDGTMSRVFNFVGVEFDQSVLEYYNLSDKSQIEPEEFFGWKEKLLQAPDIKNIGKYKHQLTKSEISQFNQIALAPLQYFNYL